MFTISFLKTKPIPKTKDNIEIEIKIHKPHPNDPNDPNVILMKKSVHIKDLRDSFHGREQIMNKLKHHNIPIIPDVVYDPNPIIPTPLPKKVYIHLPDTLDDVEKDIEDIEKIKETPPKLAESELSDESSSIDFGSDFSIKTEDLNKPNDLDLDSESESASSSASASASPPPPPKPEPRKIKIKTKKITEPEIIPPSPEKIMIPASNYYMANRKLFTNKINQLFQPYIQELEDNEKDVSCENRNSSHVKLLTHQKVVRDYLNLYTPYRGLLLYHGLGAGKTNASIAIAEGMKSHKRIIIMTPASLKSNFFVELKKYGDPIFRKEQYWEKISTDGKPENITFLANTLHLSREYIKKNHGAWLFDINKPPNFKELSKENQTEIDVQLDKMIRTKYIDINYNGLNHRIFNELTQNGTINPFDNTVVIIDEAHNFIGRIVNQLKKKKTIPILMYELLLKAMDCRVVLLSGTPIINYPNEIGILYNILRGYITTWTFSINVKTNKKINRDTILSMFSREQLDMYDYIEYSGNNLKITRNPFGFINMKKRVHGGRSTKRISIFNSKKQTKRAKRKQTKKPIKFMQEGEEQQPYTIKDNIVHLHDTIGDIHLSDEDKIPSDGIPRDYYDGGYSGLGGGEEDVQYNGIRLNNSGNITDHDFVKFIQTVLNKNDLEIIRITTDHYTALPDDSDTFNNTFIDIDTMQLKNEHLFKKRILGLTSYFRSAQEQLLPQIILTEDGNTYTIIHTPMSEYQFMTYTKVRNEEAESEKRMKRAKNKKENLLNIASSYKLFSRACCNFAFPPPGRPMPDKKELADKVDLDDDKIDDMADVADATDVVKDTAEEKTYQQRIYAALEMMKGEDESGRPYLSKEGLQQYSPKFLHILENIQNPDNQGLHLFYSQFRSIEGIGIMKMILDANGYAEFKVHKNTSTGEWDIVEDETTIGKPKYALYTGTESKEEKAIILNIYNNNWYEENISETMRNKLIQISTNNFYGEIIKVFMITSSGAEGINLKNTRFVHIAEPYWHLVRTEQVIGRARRICSHYDLPEELRTVQVFLYITTFSEQQKTDKQNIEMMIRDISRTNKRPITTDETLYEISIIKDTLNRQMLKAIKESAIDCTLYKNMNRHEHLVCYGEGKIIHSNDFESFPSLAQDINEPDKYNMVQMQTKLHESKPINGVVYMIDKKTMKLYDLNRYHQGQLVEVGIIDVNDNMRVVFHDKKKMGNIDNIEKRAIPSKIVPKKNLPIIRRSKKIAIIVPFRGEDRKEQLNRFIEYMGSFMNGIDHKIFIIEQSDDGRKFNRGKLLNIGFIYAKEQGYNQFIFHDVDLLPSEELKPYYSQLSDSPIHIAKVWKRYSYKNYFGGVVSFSAKTFMKINGFPNNFWGWGGEDDELYKRIEEANISIIIPKKGSFEDLEKLATYEEKNKILKEGDLKNMVKKELLQEHDATWKTNGLNHLDYKTLNEEVLADDAIMYTLNIVGEDDVIS
jgi:hypothetical protein